jgi:hypothetical protein
MNKAIQRVPFGRLMSGEEATLYTLRAENGLCVSIIDYGGTISSIWAPDREGALEDAANRGTSSRSTLWPHTRGTDFSARFSVLLREFSRWL